MSKEAQAIIDAINKYMEVSSKVGYEFTLEEQVMLNRIIEVLENHISILLDYEIKREGK